MTRPVLLGRSGLAPTGARRVPRQAGRALTPGEVGMARQIFGTSVAYGRVKVHRGRFLPGSGDNAMTPFGEMHFPESGYRDDFSQASDAAKIWFMHEMVHVWQHQLGRCVMCQGAVLALKGGYGPESHAYDYDPDLDQGKTFSEFNMEQQGDLIAHYFDARYLVSNPSVQHP
ncbi:MAG TPA: hypothetical protein VFH49_00935, partial [Aquabacterium sp.]|nr:hypothetical protein [Aquabacterium sp.]